MFLLCPRLRRCAVAVTLGSAESRTRVAIDGGIAKPIALVAFLRDAALVLASAVGRYRGVARRSGRVIKVVDSPSRDPDQPLDPAGQAPLDAEWIEADGLGGFASGTVSGLRTRRYHGLLVTATTPPTRRMMLVSGLEVSVETPGGRWSLSAQRYAPDLVVGDGPSHLERFGLSPWPTWVFRLPDGTRVAQEILMRKGAPQVFVSWRLLPEPRAPLPSPAAPWVRLRVRPLLAGRDFHALMHENPAFSFDAEIQSDHVRFRPYARGPVVVVSSSGVYQHRPFWYRHFVYQEERNRGLDFEEDLGSPGEWSFALGAGAAEMVLSCERDVRDPETVPARAAVAAAQGFERVRRAGLGDPLEQAADQYLVARLGGRTLIAGYPWFGDWGRDTFIALRGLLLATGRVSEALEVLNAWAGMVSEGMLPNYFPDGASAPEYNSVDASLWYAVAVAETLQAAGASASGARRRLIDAVEAILDGYARGTRYGIRADGDGLLAAGVPGQQLTWMDARVDGRVITPRIGKPVEIQALWLNALAIAVAFGTASAGRWSLLLETGRASFERRFWNDDRGCLHDVVDVDHRAGTVDASLRPNQIFAVGGLPFPLLAGARARRVVDLVERALWTPMGLRSLARDEPGYAPRYAGGVAQRDDAYHQGTVWPWLLGPFVEAFVRVRVDADEARRVARARFLTSPFVHLGDAGLGHVSEIADAEPPHAPGGCPFQAWSLGELLRLHRVVLVDQRGS
jgi:predicted glycogen debranching enzyme